MRPLSFGLLLDFDLGGAHAFCGPYGVHKYPPSPLTGRRAWLSGRLGTLWGAQTSTVFVGATLALGGGRLLGDLGETSGAARRPCPRVPPRPRDRVAPWHPGALLVALNAPAHVVVPLETATTAGSHALPHPSATSTTNLSQPRTATAFRPFPATVTPTGARPLIGPPTPGREPAEGHDQAAVSRRERRPWLAGGPPLVLVFFHLRQRLSDVGGYIRPV